MPEAKWDDVRDIILFLNISHAQISRGTGVSKEQVQQILASTSEPPQSFLESLLAMESIKRVFPEKQSD